MHRKLLVLAAALVAMSFAGSAQAATPSYAKSPKLIKMFPHIKETGQLAARALSEH